MEKVAYLLFALCTLAYAQTPYDPSDWIDRADLSDPEQFVLVQNQIWQETHELVSMQRFNAPSHSTIKWGEHSYKFRATTNPELLSLEHVLDGYLPFIYLFAQNELHMMVPGKFTKMERDLLKRGFTKTGISSLRKMLFAHEYSIMTMAGAKLKEEMPENIARIIRDIEKGIPVSEEEYIARWNHAVIARKQKTDQLIIELLSMLNLRDRHILLSSALEHLMYHASGSISKFYQEPIIKGKMDRQLVNSLKKDGVIK